ncbi:MAG: glycoside hydrolase family protein [Bacteroidaceae bacterium]|nr:glycoside hydrolase family protein [Bacteroidaceae bacterium]
MTQQLKKHLCAWLMAVLCTPVLWAQNTILTVDQVTEAVTLTEPIDYVITSTTPFTTAGSIDIQNPDATVIFKNIRPSVVISSYLKKVKANGVTLTNNSNCRVSIYLQGAIVMPHSDTKNPDGTAFYPLTVYTGDNFTGESYQYNGDARQTTGPWVDTMRSFKLKRGYMLTVANMPNGTGYSHCYIANHKDIEVQLRAELAGKVGFFRIFRWQWPSKKGTCDVGPDDFNATWHYNWGAGRTSGTNYEYVPQRHHEAGESNGDGWKGAWESWDNINASDGTCTHVLGQNEPDNTSGAKEVYTYVTQPEDPREKCATTTLVDHAAEFLYSGKRIGTFACCNPNTGWVREYVDWCRENNIRVDFVATHYYIGGQSPQGCIDRLWPLYNVTGLPVWVTEWNNGANWSGESGFTTESEGWYTWGSGNDSKKNGEWLTAVLARADRPENAWLERLAVYNAVEVKREVWTNGAISEGGKIYKAYNSTFAYDDKNEYFMTWNHKAPTDLKVTYIANEKRANLTWSQVNGKQTDSLRIERKVRGEKNWTTIGKIEQPRSSILTFQDQLQGIDGLVSYRIRNYDSDRQQRLSGEASITVTGTRGSSFLQYGNIIMADAAEKTITYDYTMSAKPAIFFGLSTYNNRNLVMTPYMRSTAVTASNFKFTPIAWQHQKRTGTFTASEEWPFMAIAYGNYHFDGMDVEVGSVALKDTVDVTFKEAFPEGVTPVVVATVVGATNNTHAIMHKVWDITNTGFRCIVMYEDGFVNSKGNHIVPSVNQTLAYIAATPGDVCIDSEAGTWLAVGFGQNDVVGAEASEQYFLKSSDDPEVEPDTLRLIDPIVFCDNQTKNLPTPVVLRSRGNITVKDTDPDTQEETTFTTGFRVRRVVDESVTSGINTAAAGTADQVGWMALHTNATTPPTAIGGPVVESTYTGNELNVRVVNRIIYVDGYPQFDLFTVGGTRAASNATQTPGVYIVHAGGKVAKIVVK